MGEYTMSDRKYAVEMPQSYMVPNHSFAPPYCKSGEVRAMRAKMQDAIDRPQIWGAIVDDIPTLTTEPHEICEPYTAEEVVAMWDKLKKHCEELKAELAAEREKHQ